MRTVLVAQPVDSIAPPVETSIGIWCREMGPRLGATVLYRGFGARRPGFRPLPALHYRIWRLLSRPLERLVGRPLFASRWFCLDYCLLAAWACRGLQPDVVHVTNFPQVAWWIARAVPGARVVLHMHCEWLDQLDPDAVGYYLQRVDALVGCSGHIRDRFPPAKSPVFVSWNGVDPDRFHPGSPAETSAPPRILFVGRISPEKGVHVLCDAFERVLERIPDARLDLVGHLHPAPFEFVVGLDRDPVVKRLSRFYRGSYLQGLRDGLSERARTRVRFWGSRPHSELPERYREATVLAFPSVWSEPFGIPTVEAMASGVPVVATRAGGVPEVVEHRRTGLLVAPDDPDALADALLEVLEDPDLAARLGAEGRRRALEHFHWDVIAGRLRAFHESLT